jgi:hypothetical protein
VVAVAGFDAATVWIDANLGRGVDELSIGPVGAA